MSISKSKNDIHYDGDLRQALIQEAVNVLKHNGLESLSLRKLARDLGVSHNAPYMHFTDKEDLLATVSEEGFKILAQTIQLAMSPTDDSWYGTLENICWIYVNFVLNHPGHVQVMFQTHDAQKYPSLANASTEALSLLEDVIKTGQSQNFLQKQENSKTYATLVWSLLHGVATLVASQKMPPVMMGETTAEELTRLFIQLLYVGLQPR